MLGGSNPDRNVSEGKMNYLKLWLLTYTNPRAFADELNQAPAPKWGFFAALQRGLMDSLFTYLPVYLLGRIPPTPSNLSFFPTESYYKTLMFLGPIVLIAEWLMSSSLIHLVLRLSGKKSDIDKLLNISGFVALATGMVMIIWDGAWLMLGGMTQYTLGISHLVIDIWAIVITTVALKRILDVPVWLGILLNIAGIAASMPFAIMFMRSPI
jgi:hypothetical protein